MFLDRLEHAEKIPFIELAHLVATAKGIMTEQEQLMIDTYDREMGVEATVDDLSGMTLEDIVAAIPGERSRRAVFVEAIAIAFADGVYDDDQKRLIDRLREAFGFSEAYYEQVKTWLNEFNEVYVRGVRLVDGSQAEEPMVDAARGLDRGEG